MLDWLIQIWNRVLGVQTAVAALQAHMDVRLNAVDRKLIEVERAAGVPAARIEEIAQRCEVIHLEVLDNRELLDEIKDLLVGPPLARLVFSIEVEGNTLKGVTQMTLKPGKRYRASVTLDPPGSRLDGALSWDSSDPGVLTATPEGDGMVAEITTPADGVATLTVSGDADLGEGVRPISTVVGVIVGLEAEGLAVNFEELGDIETPEPA
jgi:hypothetical protein